MQVLGTLICYCMNEESGLSTLRQPELAGSTALRQCVVGSSPLFDTIRRHGREGETAILRFVTFVEKYDNCLWLHALEVGM